MILKKKKALYDTVSFVKATHLLCHTNGFMDGDGSIFAVKGDIYEITEKQNRDKQKKYIIQDSRDVRHEFPTPGHSQWFIPIKIEKKNKLKNIIKKYVKKEK